MKNLILPILALAVLGLAACTPKEEGTTETPSTGGETAQTVSFDSDIQPILTKNCVSCHQGEKAQEGFDVSSYETFEKGTEHGAVYTAGNSADSLLYKVVSKADGVPAMPPGDPLSAEDVEKIKAWIDSGASK